MEEHIQKSDSNSKSSLNLGRVMNTLLTARPRKLEDAISRLNSGSQTSSGSLEEPLCFFRDFVSDAVEKGETLDQILVPMIENSLKLKDSRHCNQVLILLNWLFKDELIFHALAINLVKVILRKDDHFIILGWCTLIRGLVDYTTTMNLYSNTGIHEKHANLLQILLPSISNLSSVLCSGSIVQEGFELPTRLAVAAADCILALTEASAKKTTSGVSSISTKSRETDMEKRLVPSQSTESVEKKVKSTSRLQEGSETMDVVLWNHMDELVILVQKLLAWSRKSRPLHAKGVEHALRWLQEIKVRWGSVGVKAGEYTLKTGMSLLSSCWKHYSMLLRLEDHKFSEHYLETLNQYVSGIQIYLNDYANEHAGNKDGGIATDKFFLISISLLLGRLDNKQFGNAMSEHGLQISRLLLSQLQCADEDVIDLTVSILRATIFKTNSSFIDKSLIDTQQLEILFPSLLSLLDETDIASRAAVMLIAEYCSLNIDGQCLQEVSRRLSAKSIQQRRNALDILSEIMHISSASRKFISQAMRQVISRNLLVCLSDDESLIRVQASNLLASFEPPLVLPELVRLVYCSNEKVREAASNTLVEVLKSHKQSPDAILVLIDCLSKLCENPEHPNPEYPNPARGKVEGSKFDSDQLLKLIPQWTKSVQDWNIFIEPLVNKMFSEPSNAVVIRFMSYISDNLAEAHDLVFHRVLEYMQGQQEVNEKPLFSEATSELFDRLCPLLLIRMLPLRVFNDLNSTHLYGQLLNQDVSSCIASILISRALHKFEFEDVRKLAAELCGRIHPQVLFPIIQSELEHASYSRDTLTIKACLFAICTSLVLRGINSAHHPCMIKIRKILETILLWPSLDSDQVSKAQHGCIDCLALMICAELENLDSDSVVNYVIQNITRGESSFPISFYLCMANVLISACQKISSPGGKSSLAKKIVPTLVQSLEGIMDEEMRGACIQVLFSAVYHLKSAILPYSCDLLKLSIKALNRGSHKEKMASVKLMACLMASEDVVVASISGGLLEARSVVLNLYMTDPSMELREVCKKLLECLTFPC